MSNGNNPEPWYNRQLKSEAILRVMRHIADHPADGTQCVGNDPAAIQLFQNPRIGNIRVPVEAGARVIVFASGEEALEAGSSVIIELPPDPPPGPPKFSRGWSEKELMTFVLGNYKYW
jgi:hypothetical protein